MPIIKYKSVQTGPKSQFGGEKNGLFKVEYHSGIADMVKGVPSMPANSQISIEIKSLK